MYLLALLDLAASERLTGDFRGALRALSDKRYTLDNQKLNTRGDQYDMELDGK